MTCWQGIIKCCFKNQVLKFIVVILQKLHIVKNETVSSYGLGIYGILSFDSVGVLNTDSISIHTQGAS